MKEKEDEDARLKSQAKRLDYITRALRIEEMPVLRNKYEAQVRDAGFCCCRLHAGPCAVAVAVPVDAACPDGASDVKCFAESPTRTLT